MVSPRALNFYLVFRYRDDDMLRPKYWAELK